MATTSLYLRAEPYAGPHPRQDYLAVFTGLTLVLAMGTFFVLGREQASQIVLLWVTVGCLGYAFLRRNFVAALSLYAFAVPFEQVFFAWAGGQYNTLTYIAFALIPATALIMLIFWRRIPWKETFIGLGIAALSFLPFLIYLLTDGSNYVNINALSSGGTAVDRSWSLAPILHTWRLTSGWQIHALAGSSFEH